jgi:hypothetical protein
MTQERAFWIDRLYFDARSGRGLRSSSIFGLPSRTRCCAELCSVEMQRPVLTAVVVEHRCPAMMEIKHMQTGMYLVTDVCTEHRFFQNQVLLDFGQHVVQHRTESMLCKVRFVDDRHAGELMGFMSV